MIKKLFALCLILALVVSPVLAATSDDMRDPLSWLLSLGKGKGGGQGTPGDPGPMGPQGAVLYVNCGQNQCIMNQTPNQTAGPPGATGPQGINGTQGIPGEPADILVNFTETVGPGENAYVVDVGEPGLAKLNFKIPRGYNGTAGATGATGATGPQGDPGPTGPMGPMNQTANMTAGPPGSPGSPGTAATINVNYTFTGAPGTSALVTNIGSTNAALLDFTIPSGTTDSLTFTCKACAGGTIYKGQAVYVSGAVGNNPIVCQADNTNTAKSRVVGIMVANTAANGQGSVRRAGILEPVDTRSTNTLINPNGETWAAGDLLFATTGGGLTNVRPTSGRSVKVAYNTEAAGVNGNLLAYPLENPVWSTAASGENIVLRAGDSLGTNKISIRNYVNTETAYFTSLGYASINGSDMQSKKITSVQDPINNQDAATKNYVDTRGFVNSTYNATYDAHTTLTAVYPVGSIYISVVSTNPNALFGFGTWAAFGTGRIPIGIDASNTQFDVVKETGGSNVSTSVITHTHGTTVYVGTTDGTYGTFDSSSTTPGTSEVLTSAAPAGAVTTMSLMNPYIVVYMWERTA